MKRYTKTDVARKFAEIVRETYKGPVIITDTRRDSHVLMTIEDYEKIKQALHEEVTPCDGAVTPKQS